MTFMLAGTLIRFIRSNTVISWSSRISWNNLSLFNLHYNEQSTPTMPNPTTNELGQKAVSPLRDLFVQTKSDNHIIISFNYDHQGTCKQFNLNRECSENLSVALERIRLNLAKLKKLKSKSKDRKSKLDLKTATGIAIDLSIDGNEVNSETTKNIDAWVEGAILNLDGISYQVKTNCPVVETLRLPLRILSNFIVMPDIKLHNCEIDTSKFSWFRRVSKHRRGDYQPEELIFDGLYYWYKVGSDITYCPSNDDLGDPLKLICIPSDLKKEGPEYQCISNGCVELGPTDCPFEKRHEYTVKEQSDPKSLRIVSYNILADLYADSDYSRAVLFRHCPPYALEIEYRRQLLLKEISGYNADLILLQEVDKKEFSSVYQPYLSQKGFKGVFSSKKGDLSEGASTFYRNQKFECLQTHKTALSDLIDPLFENQELIPETDAREDPVSIKDGTCDTGLSYNPRPSKEVIKDDISCHPVLGDLHSSIAKACLAKFNEIREAINLNPKLKKRIMGLRSIIQTTLLKVIGVEDKYLIVANTHLYFAPDADHIRLLQGSTCVKYLEFLKEYYFEHVKKSHSGEPNISLILCGDMNSVPECGLYRLLTAGQVESDLPDWSSNEEEKVTGLNIRTDLRFESAYKGLLYTNYTPDFNGCLDYIFIEQEGLFLDSTVPTPNHKEVIVDGGLPSRVFPSDHLALIANVKIQ